jgi:hypothetical protein
MRNHVAMLLVVLIAARCSASSAERPVFGKHATYAYMGQPVASPDGKKTVAIQLLPEDNVEDHPAVVIITNGRTKFRSRINFALNAEVLWSPDSTAFSVSGSVAGAGGVYRTEVFTLNEAGLRKIALSGVVMRRFGHPVRCGWPEEPNIGAVAWLQGSVRLLVAAQILGHSNCDSGSTFKAYEIEIPSQKVLHVYGQLESKKLFGQQLGEWLLNAPDNCIRDPKACWVPSNHTEAAVR